MELRNLIPFLDGPTNKYKWGFPKHKILVSAKDRNAPFLENIELFNYIDLY